MSDKSTQELPTSVGLRGRLCYGQNLTEMSEAGRFEVSFIVKKSEPKLKILRQMIDAKILETFGTKPPKGLLKPIKDCDEKREDGSFKHRDPAFRDHVLIRAKSKFAPQCYARDADGSKARVDADMFASGDDVVVAVDCWTYSVQGNSGVSCGLQAVLLVTKGSRPIGGSGGSGASAIDDALDGLEIEVD